MNRRLLVTGAAGFIGYHLCERLLKEKDEHAVAGEGDALAEIDASVTTGRSLAEIAEGKAQWTSSKPTGRKGPAKPKPSKAAASGATKPPAFVPIQLCKVVDHPATVTQSCRPTIGHSLRAARRAAATTDR